ncbi:hypothetical protein L1887_18898 [Cichorium endivia]|nr:hypothetical protein L1887_18898 [Cichorium endivia]
MVFGFPCSIIGSASNQLYVRTKNICRFIAVMEACLKEKLMNLREYSWKGIPISWESPWHFFHGERLVGDDGFMRFFTRLFKTIIAKVVETYQPGVIVLQCGADSVVGDRLSCFNLSTDGHAEYVRFVRKFNLPLLISHKFDKSAFGEY